VSFEVRKAIEVRGLLPMLPVGKMDKKALRREVTGASGALGAIVRPSPRR